MAGFGGVARAIDELVRLGRAPLTLEDELFELGKFGVVGEFGDCALEGVKGAIVLAQFDGAVDLLDAAGLLGEAGFGVAALDETLDLEAEAGVSGVDGFEDLPLVERLVELLALLIQLGLADDGSDEVALVPDQAERGLEVLLFGVLGGGVFEDGDANVEVVLLVHAAVDFGDEGGELLAAALLDIELEGLKQSVVGVLGEELLAEGEGAIEIVGFQAVARFIVRVFEVVVLAANLIVEAAVGAAAAA